MEPTEHDHLLIFTRYPQAGRTKTRLIPLLGAEGAADLQRRMTEQLLAHLRSLPADRPRITIHYQGGGAAAMARWLGGFAYARQVGGTLGERLDHAFAAAFAAGGRRVVAVGSDCPELKATTILAAFRGLAEREVVLGPATDGGYYLIGLRQPVAGLFADMPWGSGQLLARTVAVATALHLSLQLLEPLSDVDRPEDLHHFRDCSHP